MKRKYWLNVIRIFSMYACLLIASLSKASEAPLTSSKKHVIPIAKISSESFLSNIVDLELFDQHNKNFEVHTLENKIVLFNFIFTSCGSVCPMQTKILADIMSELSVELRKNIRFVSVSIDAKTDTPDKMLAFARAMKADYNNWFFLTGNEQNTEKLVQRLLIFNPDESNIPELHRTSLWLVDKSGRMLQRYRGDPINKKRLLLALEKINQLNKLK